MGGLSSPPTARFGGRSDRVPRPQWSAGAPAVLARSRSYACSRCSRRRAAADGNESASETGSGSEGSDLRVALVTDIGGLNDRGFNALANKGLERAEDQLGIDGRVFISDAASDYVPNLSQAARGGYDLVIGVGFLMGDALSSVATQFPDTKFAIVDFPWAALKDKPANARGLVFAEQEAGYLVGVAAATVAKGGSVSAVGGQAVPAVVAFLAGYGARREGDEPEHDGASGVLAGLRRPGEVQGARARRRSPGARRPCSRRRAAAASGALQAAKERGVWGIGVDNDQSFLGPHILTSATKKVDVAVFDTIEA